MSETHPISEYHEAFGLCVIRIKGHLDDRWAEWFESLSITLEEDETTLLICSVTDQAALHGLLKKIRDLGMPLLSVNFVNPGQAKTQEAKL